MSSFDTFVFALSILLLGFSSSVILSLSTRVRYYKDIINKRKAFFDKTLELISRNENIDVQKYLDVAFDELEMR